MAQRFTVRFSDAQERMKFDDMLERIKKYMHLRVTNPEVMELVTASYLQHVKLHPSVRFLEDIALNIHTMRTNEAIIPRNMSIQKVRKCMHEKGVKNENIKNSNYEAYALYIFLEEEGMEPCQYTTVVAGQTITYKHELALVFNEILPIPDLSVLEYEKFKHVRISTPTENHPHVVEPLKPKTQCYNYLLVDPLELYKKKTSIPEFYAFVSAVFYVGKATGTRAIDHLTTPTANNCCTQKYINALTHSGVIIVNIFHYTTEEEAFFREACLIEAIGLANLTNRQKGHLSPGCTLEEQRLFGVYFLYKAYLIYRLDSPQQVLMPRRGDVKDMVPKQKEVQNQSRQKQPEFTLSFDNEMRKLQFCLDFKEAKSFMGGELLTENEVMMKLVQDFMHRNGVGEMRASEAELSPAETFVSTYYNLKQYKDEQVENYQQQQTLSWPSLMNIAVTIQHTLGMCKDDKSALPKCFERLTDEGCKHLADVLALLPLPPPSPEVKPIACKEAYYNYLLLNPTKLKPRPIGEVQHFDDFINAVFYVGSGKATSDTNHLTESETNKAKQDRIKQLGDSGVIVHHFHCTTETEAIHRETCMIEAIGSNNLTNGWIVNLHLQEEHRWERRHHGVHFLYKAYLIYLLDSPQPVTNGHLWKT